MTPDTPGGATPPASDTPDRTSPPPAAAATVDPLRDRWDEARRRQDVAPSNAALGELAGALRQWSGDRRAERRWRTVWRVLWLLLAIGALASMLHRGGPTRATGAVHTAVVELRGEISATSDASADNLLQGLRDAFADPASKAVVLRISSPGGSPVQAGIVHDEILRLKAKHKKHVYAVVEEMCASAAYYIAVAADDIVVDKASLVGSIGVIIDGFGFTGAMQKLGIERRLITAGENKAILDPFSPENPKQRAYIQQMVDQIHQQFVTVVRNGRAGRLKEQPDTFSGLVWNGQEAVKFGLADRLGSVDQIARDVVKADDIVDFTIRGSIAERLARRFGKATAEAFAHELLMRGGLHAPQATR